MTLSILTNTSSLNAQNNLTKSESSLSSATEDLSSGLKINSSADNAAGFAIATNYTTEIGGVEQASSNASDAISLAQTTTSALSSITSDLQSVRDLAVEAANGTYTASDRSSINTTVQQYLSEVTQIANQTSFNGINTLNGSSSSVSFQVGSEVGQSITVNLGSGVTASQMGSVTEATTVNLSGAFVSSDDADTSTTMNLSGITIDNVKLSGTASSAQDVVDAINNAGITDGTATVSAALNGSGGIDIIQSSGVLSISDSGSISSGSVLGASSVTSITSGATSVNGSTSIDAATAGSLTASGGTTSGGSLASDTSNVLTVQNANILIARIDSALSTVSNLQSNLGAIQDRFQSTISNLSSESTNMTSSQSTVQDADFATETADLSKSEVLEQAGISVLATANSQPQEILKLLQ